jgi:hypothetical protein
MFSGRSKNSRRTGKFAPRLLNLYWANENVRLLVKLPDLLFGVATSDHQAEAYDPNYADFRDQWESTKIRLRVVEQPISGIVMRKILD